VSSGNKAISTVIPAVPPACKDATSNQNVQSTSVLKLGNIIMHFRVPSGQIAHPLKVFILFGETCETSP
jgi:hypothetical protein